MLKEEFIMKISICIFAVFYMSLIIGCNSTSKETNSQTPMKQKRDINAVKEAHSGELMKIPGVVGVYVGEFDGGTPFICVMVEKKNKELEQKIPKILEGYTVQIEETGKIELR